MTGQGLASPGKERASPPTAGQLDLGTLNIAPTPEGMSTSTITATADDDVAIDAAQRLVAGLRYGRRSHLLGCPMGCPPGRHEPPCTVGQPIPAATDRRRAGPWLVITVDRERELALVRGPGAERAVYLVSPADFEWAPQWSPSRRGWVVPESAVADLVALAQADKQLAVVHDRKDGD
jgi:hypothetical protein